jgi:hypothetical protein
MAALPAATGRTTSPTKNVALSAQKIPAKPGLEGLLDQAKHNHPRCDHDRGHRTRQDALLRRGRSPGRLFNQTIQSADQSTETRFRGHG